MASRTTMVSWLWATYPRRVAILLLTIISTSGLLALAMPPPTMLRWTEVGNVLFWISGSTLLAARSARQVASAAWIGAAVTGASAGLSLLRGVEGWPFGWVATAMCASFTAVAFRRHRALARAAAWDGTPPTSGHLRIRGGETIPLEFGPGLLDLDTGQPLFYIAYAEAERTEVTGRVVAFEYEPAGAPVNLMMITGADGRTWLQPRPASAPPKHANETPSE